MSVEGPIKEYPEQTWQMWFNAMEELDWDLDEVAEFFGGLVPEGVRVMHAWWDKPGQYRHDAPLIQAAITSLAQHRGEWSAPRMKLHLDGLQRVFQDFGQFGYEQWKEHLEGVAPDDLLVKNAKGGVDFDAIGAYYLTTRDMVEEVSDGRSAFFTRPGFEGEAGAHFPSRTAR